MTDDVSRENWEKYGNPDGPQAASFGIALPSWIVEKQNSLWVLAVYMGIFMIALPVLVVSYPDSSSKLWSLSHSDALRMLTWWICLNFFFAVAQSHNPNALCTGRLNPPVYARD